MSLAGQSLIPGLAGLAGAAVVAGVLTLVAAPDHLNERLSLIRGSAAHSSDVPGLPQPNAALCEQDLHRAQGVAATQLQAQAMGAGLTVDALEFQALASSPSGLTGAAFHLAVSGSDRALSGFVAGVAEQRAPLFIATAELTPSGPGLVHAVFEGSLMCARGRA